MKHSVRYYKGFKEDVKERTHRCTHTDACAIWNVNIALQTDAKLVNIPRATFNCISLDKIHLCFYEQESSALLSVFYNLQLQNSSKTMEGTDSLEECTRWDSQ